MYQSLEFFAPKPSFITTQLEIKNTDTLREIYAHSFNKQLFEGTLSKPVFGKYLCDDAYYLMQYAQILKKLSAKMELNPLAKQLTQLAEEIIGGEQDMQQQYREYFELTPDAEPGEVILSYIKFLETQAEEAPLPVALCSILPCFWIYYQLGATPISQEKLLSNPYQEWIKTYSFEGFINATKALADTIDRLADKADDNTQEQMALAMTQSINYELQFFNSVDPAQELKCEASAPMGFK